MSLEFPEGSGVNFGYLQQIANLTLRTFSFWIYKTAAPIGTSDHVGGNFSDEAGVLISVTTNRQIQFYSKNWGLGIWQTPNNSVPLNQWVHGVITMDVTTHTNDPSIIINGSTQTLTETATPSASRVSEYGANFVLGNVLTATGNFNRAFEGKISRFCVFESILQSTDITDLYNDNVNNQWYLDHNIRFYAPVIKTERLARYLDTALTSDMKVQDAFLFCVGTPHGGPIWRSP